MILNKPVATGGTTFITNLSIDLTDIDEEYYSKVHGKITIYGEEKYYYLLVGKKPNIISGQQLFMSDPTSDIKYVDSSLNTTEYTNYAYKFWCYDVIDIGGIINNANDTGKIQLMKQILVEQGILESTNDELHTLFNGFANPYEFDSNISQGFATTFGFDWFSYVTERPVSNTTANKVNADIVINNIIQFLTNAGCQIPTDEERGRTPENESIFRKLTKTPNNLDYRLDTYRVFNGSAGNDNVYSIYGPYRNNGGIDYIRSPFYRCDWSSSAISSDGKTITLPVYCELGTGMGYYNPGKTSYNIVAVNPFIDWLFFSGYGYQGVEGSQGCAVIGGIELIE